VNALVFSIAHNGFAHKFRPCLRSQQRYCERQGYAYVAATRPLRVPDPALSAWLKVPLLLAAIRGGYDVVMYVDADCRIQDRAPAIEPFVNAEKDIHMALGRTGRMNSGVIVAKGGSGADRFLATTLDSATHDVPEADRARLKYENGNLIHVARRLGGVGILDPRWNNTENPDAEDYVRHYTGPMAARYHQRRFTTALLRAIATTIDPPRSQPARRPESFRRALDTLTRTTVARYPALAGQSLSA